MIAVLDNARPCQVINWSRYSKDGSEITGSNDITVLTRSYDKMGIGNTLPLVNYRLHASCLQVT